MVVEFMGPTTKALHKGLQKPCYVTGNHASKVGDPTLGCFAPLIPLAWGVQIGQSRIRTPHLKGIKGTKRPRFEGKARIKGKAREKAGEGSGDGARWAPP